MTLQMSRPLLVASLAVGIFLSLSVFAHSNPNLGAGRYEGRIPGDPRSEIILKVDNALNHGPKDGTIQADFLQRCSDGKDRRGGTIVPIVFSTKRHFTGFDQTEDWHSGDVSTAKVKGRTFGSGKARGWIKNVVDRQDPPYEGFPDLPDCRTDGRLHWRAKFDHPLIRP